MRDDFDGGSLDTRLWLPYYLPHWSSREASRARYRIGDSMLSLRIEADQQPWCPEYDGWLRVSSLQTASITGQHRFRDGMIVREPQDHVVLYTQQNGYVEVRAKALDHPRNMVSLWMIGLGDRPERSAEICVFEIFGRDARARSAKVGMGLHPFGDPSIRDEFSRVSLPIDVCEFHTYGAAWTRRGVRFYVDGAEVKRVAQSPAYPMQLMLGIYEFADGPSLGPAGDYPKEFTVDWIRASRRRRP